ncbi:hypothetical protein GJ744_000136 [Endocarpon pusillum]|uniref:Uncharacterized protein n=1 Tax=Endocarpon pusillum TaxID=364733 RepID=A0A8H7AWC1_9EURO|nr:hypothetical protein GJ744_000136 [Endocarpon pusillum]
MGAVTRLMKTIAERGQRRKTSTGLKWSDEWLAVDLHCAVNQWIEETRRWQRTDGKCRIPQLKECQEENKAGKSEERGVDKNTHSPRETEQAIYSRMEVEGNRIGVVPWMPLPQ